MSDTQQRPNYADEGRYSPPSGTGEPTAWVGVVVFAGIMLVMMGAFQAIEGFVALFRDDYYLTTSSGLVLTFDYTAWGWVHLLLGVVAVLTGVGLFLGQMWARVVGIIVAVLSALVNLMFLPAYPIWCTIMIAVDVLIIYALSVHGREVRAR